MKKRYLKWLDKNVDDLSNKTFLITGCNSGIGFCVAKYLCYKKANIIMACRNIAKANDVFLSRWATAETSLNMPSPVGEGVSSTDGWGVLFFYL